MNFIIPKKNIPNTVAVYHWWSEPNEPPPCRNLRTPVVASIATLRSVSKIPIVVLDATPGGNEWENFPELLKFEVVPISCTFEKDKDKVVGWKHLSRIHDIKEWDSKFTGNQRDILYSDCDVFWLRDPVPFRVTTEKFVFDGWNSGCFYYRSKSNSYRKFFETYDRHTRSAIDFEESRKMMKKYVPYEDWYGVWDEMMLTYMFRENPELFESMPIEEHSTLRKLTKEHRNTAKMVHCNGMAIEHPFSGDPNCRGLTPVLFSEFYRHVSKILSKENLIRIYGNEVLEYCLSKQISLFDRLEELKRNTTEKGHYRVNGVL